MRKFKRSMSVILILVLVVTLLPVFSTVSHAAQKSLTAGNLELTLGNTGTGINLVSLYDIGKSTELLGSIPKPLWEIVVRNSSNDNKFILKANEGWNNVSMTDIASGIQLDWSGHSDSRWNNISVTATVVKNVANQALHWDISVTNNNTNWSIYEVAFPQVTLKTVTGNKLFIPRLQGEIVSGPGSSYRYYSTYPGGSQANSQYMALYTSTTGLYVGMHDPVPYVKSIKALGLSDQDALLLGYDHPTKNMTTAGNDFTLSGEAVWQLLLGDWYDAAMIHRYWVRQNATWYPAMNHNGRIGQPSWMKDLPVWVRMATPEEADVQIQVDKVEDFINYMGVPTGVHWYRWHKIPFDNDYPNFLPPKDAFAGGVTELQNAGARIMPYVNARIYDKKDNGLVDSDNSYELEAKPNALKDKDGIEYIERYHAKEEDGVTPVDFAVMDPSSIFWKDKMTEIALTLFNTYGVDGFYMDQLGGPAFARPWDGADPDAHNLGDDLLLDHDPNHGHPIGGGDWWIQGYRQIIENIRAQLPAGNNKIIAGEHSPEMYAKNIDAGLTWSWATSDVKFVPAVNAIYQGAFQIFGRSYQDWINHKDMVKDKASQALVYGNQVGWFPAAVVYEADLAPYLRKVIQLRDRTTDYFKAGEMARPPEINSSTWLMDTANKSGSGQTSVKRVKTGAFLKKDATGSSSLLILFANASPDNETLDINIDLSQYGLPGSQFNVQKITDGGATGENFFTSANLQQTGVTFVSNSAWAWEIKPVEVISNTTFNSMTTGSTPSSWEIDSSGGTVNIAEVPSATNKSLYLADSSTTARVKAVKSFASTTESFTVEFTARANQATDLMNVGVVSDNNANKASRVFFDKDGHIKANADTILLSNYAVNSRYYFKLVFDQAARTYDVYIDGVLIPGADNLPYYNSSVGNLSKIEFYTLLASMGSMYLDNVMVHHGYTANEDFNSMKANNAPMGWVVNQTGGTVAVENFKNDYDKSVIINDTSSIDPAEAKLSFDNNQRHVIVEFAAKAEQTNQFLGVGALRNSSGNNAVKVAFSGTDIVANDTTTLLSNYSTNTWYRFKYVVDVYTQKYDVYIDDELKGNGLPFKSSAATSISEIRFWTDPASTGTLRFDNVKVY